MKQSFAFVVQNIGGASNVTYSYNVIDDTTRAITAQNQQDSFAVLATDTDLINAINIINSKINTILNPVVPILYGSITVKYQSNGVDLETPTISNNLPLATYVYVSKTFNGYNLSSSSTENVTVDANNLNQTITFLYTQISKGSIVIKYQDENGMDLETPTINSDLNMGTYTYNNKTFSGYTFTGTDNSQSVTLSPDNLNQTIIFQYKNVTSSVTINYLDNSSNVISPQSINSNLTVGQTYNYAPITVNGYSTTDIAKDITISNDNLNQIVNFTYTQTKGSLIVKYQNSADNTDIATEKAENNLDWNSYTENSIDINGYTISGNNTQTVTINADNLNPVIIFEYTQNPVGSVTINYIDDINSTNIQTATVNSNLALGSYSYDAPSISGYTLSTTDTSPKSITLTSDNLNQIIEFIYTVNA